MSTRKQFEFGIFVLLLIAAAVPVLVDVLNHQLYLPTVSYTGPATYYVSRSGSNVGGRSWATAWNELDQIDWGVIDPGDTILLDGGSTTMVYSTTLTVGKSGAPGDPITIRLADEPGRSGHATIFGGRSTALPYCGQVNYVSETVGVQRVGILIGDYSWVVIDGTKWRGIAVHGHNRSGIRLFPDSSHITVRNVEIYDNGSAYQNNGRWFPRGEGVDLAGTNVAFERVIIHDNGHDAFQSAGGVGEFTLRQSWLYNLRLDPTGDEPFNYCAHPDGVQIFDGGEQSGFLIEESIVGPGFMQGVILGQTLTDNGAEAVINNVVLKDVLFTKALGNNIMGYHFTRPEGWTLDHVTAHCPTTSGQCLILDGSGHTIKDSIFHSGRIYLPDGLSYYSANCQWNTVGFQLGMVANPLFINVSDSDSFSLDDYALSPGSPCIGKGSRVTSVDRLVGPPSPGEAYP